MFEHLKKLEVVGKTTLVDIPEIAPGARLRCLYAGQSNRAYFNLRLQLAGARPQAGNAEQALRLQREDDREAYPGRVIVGFEGVVDAQGVAVPFSAQAAADLCECLPDWLFDRIRNHCENPARFQEIPDESPPPAKDLIPS